MNYLILGGTYEIMYGEYSCLGAIFNILVLPFGFGSADAAIFEALSLCPDLLDHLLPLQSLINIKLTKKYF